MGPHPKNRTGVIWTWRTVRGQIANLTFWVTYYTLSNMAMDNPKPYVDHSLYLDGSGKASFLEAMRPKWLQLAVLHRRKSRSLKFQNHRMWFLSMLWTCELDRRMEHDGAAEHCRAAKGSKRRISKTSQCIKTIHFLGFMHCTPRSWSAGDFQLQKPRQSLVTKMEFWIPCEDFTYFGLTWETEHRFRLRSDLFRFFGGDGNSRHFWTMCFIPLMHGLVVTSEKVVTKDHQAQSMSPAKPFPRRLKFTPKKLEAQTKATHVG